MQTSAPGDVGAFAHSLGSKSDYPNRLCVRWSDR